MRAPATMLLAAACGGSEFQAHVAIRALFAAPANVQCVQITVTGAKRTAVESYDVAAGLSTLTLSFSGAPAGTVLISGKAFAASCGVGTADPTWLADSVQLSLAGGQSTSVSLIFHPNGEATVAADFQDDTYAVTTLAGNGTSGTQDGTGNAARFVGPGGVAQGPGGTAGVLYITDSNPATQVNTIRKLDIATKAVTTLTLSGTPGLFNLRGGLALSGTLLYVTDYCTIRKIDLAANTQSVLIGDNTCAAMGQLSALVLVGTSLYVADLERDVIRRVDLSGATPVLSVLAGQTGVRGEADGTGNAALFMSPVGVATDGTSLYVTDRLGCTVRKVTIATGATTTIAGNPLACAVVDDVGGNARFEQPTGIAFLGSSLFVSEFGNTLRRIDLATGAVVTIAGLADTPGNVDGRGSLARFNLPIMLAADSGGTFYLADNNNYEIRQISR